MDSVEWHKWLFCISSLTPAYSVCSVHGDTSPCVMCLFQVYSYLLKLYMKPSGPLHLFSTKYLLIRRNGNWIRITLYPILPRIRDGTYPISAALIRVERFTNTCSIISGRYCHVQFYRFVGGKTFIRIGNSQKIQLGLKKQNYAVQDGKISVKLDLLLGKQCWFLC